MIETKFKNTEIGPIPVDWEVKTLGEIGKFYRGRGIVKKESQSGNINAIRYAEIYTHHRNFISEYISHISVDVAKLSVELQSGDICFAGYGETLEDIGKAVAKIDSSETFAGQNTIVLRPSQKISALFYGYYLNTPVIATQKSNKANGSSIMLITPSALSDVFIAVPPLAEQEAIGEALREVDELIDGLKKLVAKKRAIKQGAMSQLLSGKSRLPGFSEPWQEVMLSEVASYGNTTAPSYVFEDEDYVCTENMISNRGGILPYDGCVIWDYVKNYVPFDILISNIRPYLKKIWLADRSGGVSADILVIRPVYEKVESAFLYSILSNDNFFDYVMEGVSGTKMPRGNKKHVMDYSFLLPPSLAEQEAIAKVLTDMDAEIEALSRKVAKYEQVKQGMMQQLLTGKIRLVKHPIA